MQKAASAIETRLHQTRFPIPPVGLQLLEIDRNKEKRDVNKFLGPRLHNKLPAAGEIKERDSPMPKEERKGNGNIFTMHAKRKVNL